MHVIIAADFPLFCSNSAQSRQNARLKNRLFCLKFCRQNLSKPSLNTLIKAASLTASDLSALLLPVWVSPPVSPIMTLLGIFLFLFNINWHCVSGDNGSIEGNCWSKSNGNPSSSVRAASLMWFIFIAKGNSWPALRKSSLLLGNVIFKMFCSQILPAIHTKLNMLSFRLWFYSVLLLIIISVMRFIHEPPARILGATLSMALINWLIDWLTV